MVTPMQEIHVEVAYATASQQYLVDVVVPAGSRLAAAVEHSGLLQRLPEINWPGTPVGIFGKEVSPDTVLAHGDRVEIYRPLRVDPKTRRRERAQS